MSANIADISSCTKRIKKYPWKKDTKSDHPVPVPVPTSGGSPKTPAYKFMKSSGIKELKELKN